MPQAVIVRNRNVRYAVVGIGWISQTAMLPGFGHTGNSEVVAFVSGHEDKAAKVAEKYGVKGLYSYEHTTNSWAPERSMPSISLRRTGTTSISPFARSMPAFIYCLKSLWQRQSKTASASSQRRNAAARS